MPVDASRLHVLPSRGRWRRSARPDAGAVRLAVRRPASRPARSGRAAHVRDGRRRAGGRPARRRVRRRGRGPADRARGPDIGVRPRDRRRLPAVGDRGGHRRGRGVRARAAVGSGAPPPRGGLHRRARGGGRGARRRPLDPPDHELPDPGGRHPRPAPLLRGADAAGQLVELSAAQARRRIERGRGGARGDLLLPRRGPARHGRPPHLRPRRGVGRAPSRSATATPSSSRAGSTAPAWRRPTTPSGT